MHSHTGDLHIGTIEKAKEEMANRFQASTITPLQVFAELINNLPSKAKVHVERKLRKNIVAKS